MLRSSLLRDKIFLRDTILSQICGLCCRQLQILTLDGIQVAALHHIVTDLKQETPTLEKNKVKHRHQVEGGEELQEILWIIIRILVDDLSFNTPPSLHSASKLNLIGIKMHHNHPIVQFSGSSWRNAFTSRVLGNFLLSLVIKFPGFVVKLIVGSRRENPISHPASADGSKDPVLHFRIIIRIFQI